MSPTKTYVILLRGINVGGKNKVEMARLKAVLEALGYSRVSTYIASGNVIVRSHKDAAGIQAEVEAALSQNFALDGGSIKALVLTRDQLQAVVDNRPQNFGDRPDQYHSDAIFLMGLNAAEAIAEFDPREGVDVVWPGDGVIYSQRLSALRTKSKLNKIMATPLYKAMTIRNWNTTTKLASLLQAADDEAE